jgi:hypothetical protein
MRYLITFTANKTVQDWDDKDGASGAFREVDTWSATIESNAKPTQEDFSDFVYDRYSLKANQFRHWPDEPGRFSLSRIEDRDGQGDPKGKFLADYDVNVTCRPISYDVPVGTFGTKPIDQ